MENTKLNYNLDEDIVDSDTFETIMGMIDCFRCDHNDLIDFTNAFRTNKVTGPYYQKVVDNLSDMDDHSNIYIIMKAFELMNK